MNKKFISCAGSLMVFFVIIIVGGIVGFNFIKNSIQMSILKDMGFSSRVEFDEFTNKLNASYDEQVFYQNTYANADKIALTKKLSDSITFSDSSKLFLENGYFNLDALEIKENANLNANLSFNYHEYSYFLQLILSSVYNSSKNTSPQQMEIISLTFDHVQKYTAIVKLDTAHIKKSLSSFGTSLPNKLYLTLSYDIIKQTQKLEVINPILKVNNLDETTNKQCISFLNKVYNSSNSAETFANFIIMLTNSFDESINSTSTFDKEEIIMAKNS